MSRYSLDGRHRYTRAERIERILDWAESYEATADHLAARADDALRDGNLRLSQSFASAARANRHHAARTHRRWLRLTNPHNAAPASGPVETPAEVGSGEGAIA